MPNSMESKESLFLRLSKSGSFNKEQKSSLYKLLMEYSSPSELRFTAYPESKLYADSPEYANVVTSHLKIGKVVSREQQKTEIYNEAYQMSKSQNFNPGRFLPDVTAGPATREKQNLLFSQSTQRNSSTNSKVESTNTGEVPRSSGDYGNSPSGTGATASVPNVTHSRRRSRFSRQGGMIPHLLATGNAPEKICILSDVLEEPRLIRKMQLSLANWLEIQRRKGYWFDRASVIMLAVAVAIGNRHSESIWRLVHKWGLTCFFPYLMCYILVCVPLLTLDLAAGQLTRCYPPNLMAIFNPRARGVGIVMILLLILSGCIVQARYAAELFVFLFYSLQQPQPWLLTDAERAACDAAGSIEAACTAASPACIYSVGLQTCLPIESAKASYFFKVTLSPHLLDDADQLNNVDLRIILGLLVAWGLTAFFLTLGLRGLSFAAAGTLVMMGIIYIVQIVVGFQFDGVSYAYSALLANWDWSLLSKYPQIWAESLIACIMDLSVAHGIYSSLTMYSRLGYNVTWDSYTIIIGDLGSSFITFLSAAGIMGYMAKKSHNTFKYLIEATARSYIFVIFPVGFQYAGTIETTLYIVYYGGTGMLMCKTIAICLEATLGSIKENQKFQGLPRNVVLTVLLISVALLSLGLATRGGRQTSYFLDYYVADVTRLVVVGFIVIYIGWISGFQRQAEKIGPTVTLIFNSLTMLNFTVYAIVIFIIGETASLGGWKYLMRWGTTVFTYLLCLTIATKFDGQDCEKLRRFFKIKPKKKKLSLAEWSWWLLVGNAEELRVVISRVTSPYTYFIGNVTIFWSICMKWMICPILFGAILNIIIECFYPGETRYGKLEGMSLGWLVLTLALYAILLITLLLPMLFPNKIPKSLTFPNGAHISLTSLPARTKKLVEAQNATVILPQYNEFFYARGSNYLVKELGIDESLIQPIR